MTLDVIGKEGFNYDFDALEEANGWPNELNEAFTELLHSPGASRYALARLVQSMIPVLRSLVCSQPAPWRAPRNARTKMDIIANQIVMESKANAKLEGLEAKRDLVSVLVKANMSPSLPQSQRPTHAEVIAQIPTFFVAGHETTRSSRPTPPPPRIPKPAREKPCMHDQLHEQEQLIRNHPSGPYAPAALTQRMATEDDAAPLPKPYIDEAGKSDDSLLIPKGQIIHIQPILTVNTDKEVWGEDAREFNAERTSQTPPASSPAYEPIYSPPSLGRPTASASCSPSLSILKALLFTLICAFEFEAAMPKGGIRPKMSGVTGILQTPVVLGEEEKGSTLPLIVRPYITQ
ncbi:cytochrome P450 [Mycena olivaceomarginata]|nr:cytochrome P450 [Mycena olivaceomarginata]